MECIVHYDYNDEKYSELKSLSENQYERIKEAINISTQSTERNQHLQQCATVPENGYNKLIHGIHLEPCYKKFIGIIAKSKKRSESSDVPRSSKRVKQQENEAGTSTSTPVFFPKICFFVKIGGKP